MHRLIMNTPIGLTVDHIDHDGLNNQKTNLRNCTMKENSMNKSKNKGFSTKYKGVYVFRNKFAVNIRVDDKIIFLGVFDNAVDGAREYDKAAIKYFGEFAHLNFPKEDYL